MTLRSPVFLGLARPPKYLGLPIGYLVVLVVGTVIPFVLTKAMWVLAAGGRRSTCLCGSWPTASRATSRSCASRTAWCGGPSMPLDGSGYTRPSAAVRAGHGPRGLPPAPSWARACPM